MYVDGQFSMEDPQLKPKRDPTMFVEGQSDPDIYTEDGEYDPEAYVEGQRDPTMYVDGASASQYSTSQGRGGASVGYSADPYGMSGIDEEGEYDEYSFKHSELDERYMTSESNAEYPRGQRDPSYYVQEENFQAGEPSVSGKSGRSK